MSTEALQVRDNTAASALTAQDMRAQVNLIQEVMRAVMRDGIHYGKLPGCGDKPTLLKPGAEKILSTFRIAVMPEVVDMSTPDKAHYRVTAKGVTMQGGNVVGCGIGECSSFEEKYKWRAAVCDEEFNETADNRRRLKWAKGPNGKVYQKKQVRTEPADIANTVLKMAKKRAQVDLCLTATSASDVFTQDIEDLPEELAHTVADERPAAPPVKSGVEQARAKIVPPSPPPNTEAQLDSTLIGMIEKEAKPKTGTSKDGKPWTKFGFLVAGEWYGTFSETLAAQVREFHAAGVQVEIAWQQSGQYRTLTDIRQAPLPAADSATTAEQQPKQ